jgi:hypothetical protein
MCELYRELIGLHTGLLLKGVFQVMIGRSGSSRRRRLVEPRYSRGVMQVSARLPDGMFMIWRLWTLTAEATSPACVEAVERRLVSPEWDWWGRESVP